MRLLVLLSLFGLGVCQYDPNVTPTEFVTCAKDRGCVHLSQCGKDDFIITDGGFAIDKRTGLGGEKCDLFKGNICCRIPGYTPPTPPPTSPICSFEFDCVPLELCGNDGRIITDGGGIIQKRIQPTNPCQSPDYPGAKGICCLKPGFEPTTPLKDCFGGETCENKNKCKNPVFDSFNNFQACYRKNGNEGVCCLDQPVYDLCGHGQVCKNLNRCNSPFYDTHNNLVPCLKNNGKEGTCCFDDKPVTKKPPTIPNKADKCGFKNVRDVARIATKLGDKESFFGEFPWQAIIFNQSYTFQCGAAIISERFLLTAAHCVEDFATYPEGISIRVGDYQVDVFDEPLPYEDHKVAAIYVHPGYNTRNNHKGIALIELLDPLTFQYHINSICLPSGPYSHFGPLADFTSKYDHQECYVSGWGKDAFHGRYQARMKKVHLPLLSHDHCQNLLRSHKKLNKWFLLDQSFLCLGGLQDRDACKGDGGGPVSCWNSDSGRYEVIGLTSWGLGCGEYGVPGVYIDVYHFLPWIEDVVSKSSHFQQGTFTQYGKK